MDIEKRFDQIENDLKMNVSSIGELQTMIMGPPPNRNEGIKVDLKTLTKKVDDAIDWANDIWNIKRRSECLGLEESEKIWTEISKMKQEVVEMSVAKTNLKGVYVMGALQFIGMVLVALIASGTFK